MRKTILYTAALLALAACSQQDGLGLEDADTPGGRAIQFSPAHVGKQMQTATRVVGDYSTGALTAANLGERTSLAVWGEMLPEEQNGEGEPATSEWPFESTKLEWSEDSKIWTYEGDFRIWQEDRQYRFNAMAPAFCASKATVTDGRMAITNISQTSALRQDLGGIDYLVSETCETTFAESAATGVQLNFKHILSYLTVTVDPVPELEVNITEMTLFLQQRTTASYQQMGDTPGEGDMWTEGQVFEVENYETATINDFDEEGFYSFSLLRPDPQGEADAVKPVRLLPGSEPYRGYEEFFVAPTSHTRYLRITYTLRYHTPGENPDEFYGPQETEPVTKTIAITPEMLTLRQGHRHNLHITVGERQIAFSTETAEWESDSQEVVPVFPMPEDATPRYVDFGSAGKWSPVNLGARSICDYGWYLAWGETEDKWGGHKTWSSGDRLYDAEDYSLYDFDARTGYYVNQNPLAITPADNNGSAARDGAAYFSECQSRYILEKHHDAVRAHWGDDWRIPTLADWEKLLYHISYYYEELSDEKRAIYAPDGPVLTADVTSKTDNQGNTSNGILFTYQNPNDEDDPRNGNELFLPYAGYRMGGAAVGENNLLCFFLPNLMPLYQSDFDGGRRGTFASVFGLGGDNGFGVYDYHGFWYGLVYLGMPVRPIYVGND